MKQSILIWILLLLFLLGAGFLWLIWIDMRHSAVPPEVPRRNGNRHQEEGRERRGSGAPVPCSSLGVTCSSEYFGSWVWPEDGSCHPAIRNGYPEPDRRCTPGGAVPTVTAETLRDPGWRTKCIRDCQSTSAQKRAAYAWYGLSQPEDNSGATQVCELDHLVPLELGGADGMGNIWPECGPDDVTLRKRYFKQKDLVENYLAAKVRTGEIPLDEAQRGIAANWVQYLPQATAKCREARCGDEEH